MRRAIQKHTPPATKKRNIPYSYVFKMYRCEVFSQHLDIPAAGWGCPFRTYQFLFAPKIKISRSVLLLSRGFVTRVAIAVPCHRCLRKATQMEVLRFPVGFRRDLTWLRPVTHRTSTSVGRCRYKTTRCRLEIH